MRIKQLSPPDRFSYPCSRFLRAKEIVYVVKNIAYATEEETLMGNGVNLRTLTNDGGSAVISDYGAHLLRWAPAGQPDVIWTPRTWHFEAGQPVGGGVPVCFPWFGPGFVHGGQTAKRPIHGSHDCASGRWTKGRLPVPVCGMCWIPND